MTTTILEHVRTHLDPSGTGLTSGGDRLPDEQPDDGGIRWAPGALDGVMGHHAGGGEGDGSIAARLEKASRARFRREAAREALYAAVRDSSVLGYVDDLLGSVGDATRHLETARWLVHEGRHREPVKLGIALLGRGAPSEQDREDLRVLGRHEEFTLFASVALAGTSPDPESELWALARGVTGWGRIQIIERLAGTERADIKAWLLRGGFHNSVMDEYTAWIAATTGGLADALADVPVDDELLDGAVGILRALLSGGPAEDIGDYDEAPQAVERVLELVALRPRRSSHGQLLVALAQDDRVAGPLRDRAGEILRDPRWAEVVGRELGSDDTYWDAQQLAGQVGVDAFPAIVARLEADPLDHAWFHAMQHADAERLPVLLDIAERGFDRSVVGGGPALENGFGEHYRQHTALESVVTGLGRFPGQGADLVALALRSPVLRGRNMALRTLAAWGPAAWPDDLRAAVQHAAEVEPDDRVRAACQRVLAGGPFDDPDEDAF